MATRVAFDPPLFAAEPWPYGARNVYGLLHASGRELPPDRTWYVYFCRGSSDENRMKCLKPQICHHWQQHRIPSTNQHPTSMGIK